MSQVADFKIDEEGYIRVGACKFQMIIDRTKPTKPESIMFHGNSNIVKSKQWKALAVHRYDGPAIVEYNEQGVLIKEKWYYHGQLHRYDGPAIIKYDDDGKVIYQRFYIDGKKRFWKNLFHGIG